MPELLDSTCEAQTLHAKYEQVLRFDRQMRDLVTSQLPPCLSSQSTIDSDWPCWVPLAQRSLTITSAHKIIMIHRSFVGLSFTDRRFDFTRRTCLAAAKTIINELKQELPDGSPFLWTMQAFGVAAAVSTGYIVIWCISLTVLRLFYPSISSTCIRQPKSI